MEENKKPFQLFVKLLNGKTATLKFTTPNIDTQSIKQKIHEITKVPTHAQRLIADGKQLREDAVISTPECTVNVLLRLLGGKGGFGSLLRGAATKAGQKKTNNFDACRDMSGRRLRHVNAEKRLEEWKAEDEERKLEKIAEDFIKKKANSKKGPKGRVDGEAEKYVAKYREQSAQCAKEVEDAVREACGNGNGKRKGKALLKEGFDSKRLKIWTGKRKMGESESEDSSDDEENEKSVILNNGSNSDVNKEIDGSSDSVTGGKQDGDFSGGASCESGSEEEKDAATAAVEQNLKFSPQTEVVPSVDNGVVEPEIQEEVASQSAGVTSSSTAEISGNGDVEAGGKHENVGADCQPMQVSSSGTVEVIDSKPITADTEANLADLKESDHDTPLNFDDFNTAAEMEALGMERLKNELQAHGLKCGGTLQERAARLFLLKTTPLDKLPKKLLAKK